MRYSFIFIFGLLLSAHVALAAAGNEFVPITPIPNPETGQIVTQGNNLGAYINGMFTLAIGVGAALAAIYIAIGGFMYIFSEAMPNKHLGKEYITRALTGLAILLVVTLVLFIINPDLISLRILSATP